MRNSTAPGLSQLQDDSVVTLRRLCYRSLLQHIRAYHARAVIEELRSISLTPDPTSQRLNEFSSKYDTARDENSAYMSGATVEASLHLNDCVV